MFPRRPALALSSPKPFSGLVGCVVSGPLKAIWGELLEPGSPRIARPAACAWKLSPRLQNQRGFKVLARRWIVERTFGWFMKHRRLVRDYETKIENAEAMLHLTMIGMMLRRVR